MSFDISSSSSEVAQAPIRIFSGAKTILQIPYSEFTLSGAISERIKTSLRTDVRQAMRIAVANGFTKVITSIIPFIAQDTGRLRASFLKNLTIRDDELVFNVIGFASEPIYAQYHIAQLTGQFRYADPNTAGTMPLDLRILSDLMIKTVHSSFSRELVSIGYDFRFRLITEVEIENLSQSFIGALFR